MDLPTAALHLAAINDPATGDDLKNFLSEALLRAFWTAAVEGDKAADRIVTAVFDMQHERLAQRHARRGGRG